MADTDGDRLPDDYEIEAYGDTNAVGSSVSGDTDSDGADDVAEYIAGTSATNPNDLLKVDVGLGPGGNVWVEFQTRPAQGPGYFGLSRWYDLEHTTLIEESGAWGPVSGYTDLPATGATVTYTNSTTKTMWSSRVRVSLQSAD